MSDLDARVAALMEFVDAYADTQFRDEYETHDAEITQARDAAITAIRAELQKPALHEPAQVLIEGVLKAIHSASTIIGNLPEAPGYNGSILLIDDEEAARIEKELDEAAIVLQGRAKPAREEITDAEPIARLGVTSAGYAQVIIYGVVIASYYAEKEAAQAVVDKLNAAICASKGEKT